MINRTCKLGLKRINDSIEYTFQYTSCCVRENYQYTPHVVTSVHTSSFRVHFLNYPESLWDYEHAEQFNRDNLTFDQKTFVKGLVVALSKHLTIITYYYYYYAVYAK